MADDLDLTGAAPRLAVLARAVFPDHGVGGLERHVYDLVRHLALRGVRVTLITKPATSGRRLADEGLEGVETITVPYRTFPFAGRRGTTILDRATAYPLFGLRAGRVAERLVAGGRIDIVHGLGAASLGYAIARRDGRGTAPYVMNPQGLEEFGGLDGSYGGSRLKGLGYAPLRRAVRVCAAAADRVVATDRSIEPAIGRHLAVGAGRMCLVPNAIDVETCDRLAGPADGARARALLGLPATTPLLVSVGRLEFNKGFHVLIDALRRLLDRPWAWVLVGDGPLRPQLEQQVADAGLGRRMRFAGRVDDHALHAWYEAATLFVHPTLYEGSSLVTLEAMSHRRAVVASMAGGLPDKVKPGETGWLVPPGDPGALAAAIGHALDREDGLAALGAAGRAFVEAEFAWPAVTDRLLDVYESLSAGTRRG